MATQTVLIPILGLVCSLLGALGTSAWFLTRRLAYRRKVSEVFERICICLEDQETLASRNDKTNTMGHLIPKEATHVTALDFLKRSRGDRPAVMSHLDLIAVSLFPSQFLYWSAATFGTAFVLVIVLVFVMQFDTIRIFIAGLGPEAIWLGYVLGVGATSVVAVFLFSVIKFERDLDTVRGIAEKSAIWAAGYSATAERPLREWKDDPQFSEINKGS